MELMNFADYQDIALLVLRIAVAAVFLVHGLGKLRALDGASAGLAMPKALVMMLAIVEVSSAALLLVGVFVSCAAIAQMLIMIGATYYKIAKWKLPFMAMQATGWELDMVLFAAAFALMAFGGGVYSI
jgi:uncharacterized membrane protein YphA (DoxX/SURF4 family)